MILALVLLPIIVLAVEIGPIEEPIEEPIEIKSILNQTNFWFRDDDGTETLATGYGSLDTGKDANITNVALGAVFRLRFGIRVTRWIGILVPKLEFKQGTDCTSGSWTAITPTSDTFSLRLSENFSDGDPTTKQITNGSFVAGQILESTNPASSLNLPRNKNTEYEWSLQATSNIAAGTTYSFRLTNNGTALNNYDQCPSLTIQSESEPIQSGGGSSTRPTTVTFSGKAFPGAKILVVDKYIKSETTVSQDLVADEEGEFSVSFIGIIQKRHSFGLLIKDKENRTTQTKFFTIDTHLDDWVVKDIFVSPTVGFLQRLVSRGQPIIIIGNASPNNSVILEMDDIIKKEVNVEKDGSYKVALETGILEFGTHLVRVKQVDTSQKQESDYSPTNAFVVSRLTLPKADLSGDGIVNIKDWSMFLSNWGSKDESQKKMIDFNEDGKVDISDFSIFIRAIRK